MNILRDKLICKNCNCSFVKFKKTSIFCSKECNYAFKSYNSVEKIQAKCLISLDTGCWEWQGAKDKDGYGLLTIRNRQEKAHRASLFLSGKLSIGGGKDWVLHHCDNPSCCNPEHLYAGDAKDNSRDIKNRKRRAIGSKIKHSKLDERKAEFIKNSDLKDKELARKFGVSIACVRSVRSYKKTWTHV